MFERCRLLKPAAFPVMSAFQLPDQTRLSRVHLRVRDLGRMLAFYEQAVGLRVVERSGEQASLSATGRGPAWLVLSADPDATPRPPRSTGLYHVAIRFPTRRDLAGALRRVTGHGHRLDGASDHGFSEALYLDDPEGNGVELCTDRPRDRWPRRDGRLSGFTLPLDIGDLVAAAGGETAPSSVPATTNLGHIHLHVADLTDAHRFYHDYVGFDATLEYPGARFFSAGGYHHHIGTNIWAGTRPAPEGSTGLISYRFAVPVAEVLYCLRQRAPLAGYEARTDPAEDGAELLRLRDPNGHWLELRAAMD